MSAVALSLSTGAEDEGGDPAMLTVRTVDSESVALDKSHRGVLSDRQGQCEGRDDKGAQPLCGKRLPEFP